MSGSHFYLTLPSNALLDVFPNNKTTEFHVKLLQTVNLEGDWEVEVYSISYPHTWHTLRDFNQDTNFCGDDCSGFYSSITMDYGYYESIQEFIKDANKALKNRIGDEYLRIAQKQEK